MNKLLLDKENLAITKEPYWNEYNELCPGMIIFLIKNQEFGTLDIAEKMVNEYNKLLSV